MMRAWSLGVFSLLISLCNGTATGTTCSYVTISNANVTYKPPDPVEIEEGVTVSVTCDEGYVVQYTEGYVNSQTATCHASGQWSTWIAPCVEIVCPTPTEYDNTAQTYLNNDLNSTAYGQTVEYRCVSGKYFETNIRPDGSETVVVECDTYGQWSVIKGAVSNSNHSDDQFKCRALSEYMGCYDTTLPYYPAETIYPVLDTDNAIILECRSHCAQQSYLYAALQGHTCQCANYSDFQSTKVPKERCDGTCRNQALHCGGDDEYSVFRAFDSCIEASETHIKLLTSSYMYNSGTCIQYCRGRDDTLAFYRQSIRLCICVNVVPPYTRKNPLSCSTPYGSEANTLIGNLYSVAERSEVTFNSCGDLFDSGIFYHGDYYLQNGSMIHCHFLDGSMTCDQGWVAYNGHCYHLLETTNNVWYQASACRNFSSLLTSVSDNREWSFMNRMVQALPYSPSHFFIGLYDIHDTYNFQWADETAFTYRPFDHNYPQLVKDYKRCATVHHSHIHNQNCYTFRQAICEKSGSPVGFTEVPMHFCDLPCTDNTLQICGSTSYAYYFVTQDTGQALRESCDAMLLDGLATTALVSPGIAQDCSAISAISNCPASWLPINERCYRPIREGSSQAALACIMMDGYLAVLETKVEREANGNRIKATESLAEIPQWIGGLARAVGNVTKYTYANEAWVSQEDMAAAPNTTGDSCALYDIDFAIANETAKCNSKPFICEKGSDYKGCHKRLTASSGHRVISNYPLMNLRLCKETCTPVIAAGYSLYGVTLDPLPTCYCLMPGDIEKENPSLCTETCYGHQACGAENIISVYEHVSKTPPSTCEELYNQGVLLSGLYELESPGAYTLCHMPDSEYAGSYPPCIGVNCVVERVTIGRAWDVISVDVTTPIRHSDPGITCYNTIEPGATTVASIRTQEKLDLLIDFLNWSVTGQTSTVIGLIDQFLTGSYTWSDGYLFRPSQLNLTAAGLPPLRDRSQAGYVTINHLGHVTGHTEQHNVACMLDTNVYRYPDCYFFMSEPSLIAVAGYASMTVTLCRQKCQALGFLTVFVSKLDCVCGDDSSAIVDLTLSLDECTQPCPGNSLQLCGAKIDGGYTHFRKYSFAEIDYATDCRELWDNMVVYEGVYKMSTAPWQTNYTGPCHMEDNSMPECQAGFLSKQDMCLRFIRLETETVTQAARSCLALNSRLASILNTDDLEAVMYIAQNITSLSTARLWAIGHYSPLSNGYYVDSFGNLIPQSSPILGNITLAQQCMALDTELQVLVSVSCDTVLPYICHHKSSYYELNQAVLLSETSVPDLSLPTSMTTHQCIEFCRKQVTSEVVLVKDGDCFCDVTPFSYAHVNWTDYVTCPGNPSQFCGFSTRFGVHAKALIEEQQYKTCDELLNYGITAPGTYVMEDGTQMSCFMYTSLSDYIMANNDNITVEASSVLDSSITSSDAKLDIRTLRPGGWVGAASATEYSLSFDLLETFMIQGIILWGVEGYDHMTSMSISHKLLVTYSENYFLNPVTISSPPTWIDIQQPFVARYVTITFNAWSGSRPGCSLEFIGYKFYELWEDTYFLGAREHVQNESSITTVLTTTTIEECVNTCRNSGFNYFKLNEGPSPDPSTALCSCIKPEVSTRDFYTFPAGYPCIGLQVCGTNSSPLDFLYSTADPTCELPSTTNAETVEIPAAWNAPTSSDRTSIGSLLYVTCSEGYESTQWTDLFFMSCLNYGRWYPTPVDLTCTPVDCGTPPQLTNLTLATTNGSVSTVYLSQVDYECQAHGHLINGTDLTWQVECSDSGQWLPSQPPPCIPKICDAPTPVTNSSLVAVPENYYVYGDVAVIKCDPGCVFNGTYSNSFNMLCQMDGTWDSRPEVPCIALDCPPTLPPISHASASLASDLSGVYECNGGREFPNQQATKTVLCDHDTNQWPETTATDVCSKTKQFGTSVCRVQKDKCLNDNLIGEINSYSLLDCIVACSDTEFCRSVCFHRDSYTSGGQPNCLLVSSGWMFEFDVDMSGWDFYDTFGLDCS